MEPDYGMDSSLWDDSLLWWGDYSEYLPGRYVQTSATSTRDLHLGHVSMGDPYTLAAGHNPIIQTSHWEGRMAKGCSEHEGSSATGSLDCTHNLPAASTSPGSTSNPYQQVVWPPIRTLGPTVTFDSSTTKTAPTGSQDTDVCGRQVSRG